jgi:hypothetical protein
MVGGYGERYVSLHGCQRDMRVDPLSPLARLVNFCICRGLQLW